MITRKYPMVGCSILAALLVFVVAGRASAEEPGRWVFESDDPNDPNWTCVSNGFMGVKVPTEGQGWTTPAKQKLRPHLIAGLWAYHGTKDTYLRRNQWKAASEAVIWSELGYHDGDGWFDSGPTNGRIERFRQALDIRSGIVTTRLRWVHGDKATDIEVSIFAARHERHLGVVQYRITPQFSGDVQFSVPLGSAFKLKAVSGPKDDPLAPVWMYGQTSRPGFAPFAAVAAVGLSKNIKRPVITRPQLQLWNAAKKQYEETDVSHRSGFGHSRVDWRLRFKARKRKTYVITKYVAVMADPGGEIGQELDVTDEPAAAMLHNAKTLAAEAVSQGYDKVRQAHAAAMAKLWETDIIIDGPQEDQDLIRACIFYTVGALHADEPWGATVCGLTWPLYGGGVFGDQEIFVLPPMSVMHPPLARSMLQYRFNAMPRSNQLSHYRGLTRKGVEFAWDARWDGHEHAPYPYSENRRITAYVGYAAWRYYLASRDLEWLKQIGWPILRETARYWTARSHYNREKDRYEILKVMPPTEAQVVDNNCYTNGYAIKNLQAAVAALKVLSAAKALDKSDLTSAERQGKLWRQVAEKMFLPFDEKRQIYMFHDAVDPKHPPYTADVHWMIYPMDMEMSEPVRNAVANEFLKRTRPGFYSLTSGQNAGVYNELGKRLETYNEFRTWKKCTSAPFYVVNEMGNQRPQHEVFISGAGGYLTAALYGIVGLRLRDNGIRLNPLLPEAWKSVTLKNFHFGGGRYDIRIDKGDAIEIRRLDGPSDIRFIDKAGDALPVIDSPGSDGKRKRGNTKEKGNPGKGASFFLGNPRLRVEVMRPGHPQAVYRGTRFEWGGTILQVTLDGKHTFMTTEKQGRPPGGCGTAEEMIGAIGYRADAPAPFVKIGVGLCESTGRPYNANHTYRILDDLGWKTTVKKNGRLAVFSQRLKDFQGWGYHYEKQLVLDPDLAELKIVHRLKNTGKKPIKVSQYCHNFMRFDQQPAGPDYVAEFPFTPELPAHDIVGTAGDTVVFKKKLTQGAVYSVIKGYDPKADNPFVLRHRGAGLAVRFGRDFPIQSLVLWATPAMVCLEPMIALHLEPGQKKKWTTTYMFVKD